MENPILSIIPSADDYRLHHVVHKTPSGTPTPGSTDPPVIQSDSEHVYAAGAVGAAVKPSNDDPSSGAAHRCPPNGFCDQHPQTLTREQFEIDGKRRRFRVISAPICRHNVKKCMQSFQSLPARTRQSLQFAGIIATSALVVVAIFYLARLGEETESTVSRKVIFSEKEHYQLDLNPLEGGKDEYNIPPLDYDVEKDVIHNGMRLPLKIIKDAEGKAKEYDKLFPIDPMAIPLNPRGLQLPPYVNIDRFKPLRRKLKKPANATEIKQTLDIVRQRVDSDRKKIFDKELRYWETGSAPLRVLLVSTWRSGSTFLGQVLCSHPGVFQHYEPLSYFGVRQVRSGKDAFQAQQLLHRLLDCNYKGLDEYMNYTRKNAQDMLSHNKRVWDACSKGPNAMACQNEDFLSESCQMFPIQLVKTVRMRLNATQLLLNDARLRVKVIFLVRDPRGTMSSRFSSVDWCVKSPDCNSPMSLCHDLMGDLKVATAFEKLYPERFLKVKYEDLSSNPEDVTGNILSFLGLEFSDDVRSLVKQNTQSDVDKPWSISRKSSDRVNIWKKNLEPEQVYQIQDACEPVLKALKYDILPKN